MNHTEFSQKMLAQNQLSFSGSCFEKMQIERGFEPGMMVHTYNPCTRKLRQKNHREFKANMSYMVNSRPVRVTVRPCVQDRGEVGLIESLCTLGDMLVRVL